MLYKKSWLTWETLPAYFGTIDLYTGYTFKNQHSLNLALLFSFPFPDKTGSMEDYDALLYDGIVTDYSKHDNYTDNLLSAGFSVNYTFFGGLGIGIEFEYEKIHFRSKNGYAQHNTDLYGHTHGYWNPDMAHSDEYDGAIVITYDVTSFYWKPGITWHFSLTKSLKIGFDIWLHMYRYNRALDIHYSIVPNIPSSYFTDIVETWFSGANAQATVEYGFTKNFSLSLNISGTYLPDAQGDDYSGKPPKYKLNEDYKGGFGAWNASACISAIFRL